MARKPKSRKTFSLMMEIDGVSYYVSRIDWRREYKDDTVNYDYWGNTSQNWDYFHTFCLTPKTSSAKKWKTKEGILKAVENYTKGGRYEVKLGRELIHKKGAPIWNNVIDEYIKVISDEKEMFKERIIKEKDINYNADNLVKTIRNINKFKNKKRKQPHKNSFSIIDSSHNFRKIKLKELMEKNGELDG